MREKCDVWSHLAGNEVAVMRNIIAIVVLRHKYERQSCICDIQGSNYFLFCIYLLNKLFYLHRTIQINTCSQMCILGLRSLICYIFYLTTQCRRQHLGDVYILTHTYSALNAAQAMVWEQHVVQLISSVVGFAYSLLIYGGQS